MRTENGHYLILGFPMDKGGSRSRIDFIGFGNSSELPTNLNGHPLSYYQGADTRVIAILWGTEGASPSIYELKEHKVSSWGLTARD